MAAAELVHWILPQLIWHARSWQHANLWEMLATRITHAAGELSCAQCNQYKCLHAATAQVREIQLTESIARSLSCRSLYA